MIDLESRFNLADESWIPITGAGRVSLRQIFENPHYRSLGGNPVQKIALMKLLLAIAQAAATPADEKAWRALGAEALARRALAYLDSWHERLYLYGARPFLQMTAIGAAELQRYGAVLPDVSTGNTTVLTHGQVERALDDGQKALLLLGLMSFALGGKKADNSVILTPGYLGKTRSCKPGPSIAHMGLLHSYVIGNRLQETLWLNLLTVRQVERAMIFPEGIGTAPWEQMPAGEDCPVAQRLKQSLMGRLVPLSRFCLLAKEGLHYSEGLAHAGYKDGVWDPSVAVDHSGKEPRALWVDPQRRPWRELTSLLGFIEQGGKTGFQSLQLRAGLDRARAATQGFAIWSGGLRVSSNAGEQYVSGSDDFVESQVWLHRSALGERWFLQFKAEMDALADLAKVLYGRVMAFFREQRVADSKLAALASTLFWELCERHLQQLVDACEPDEQSAEQRRQLRRTFAGYVHQSYDRFCPNETARQLEVWAKCRPNNSTYLGQVV